MSATLISMAASFAGLCGSRARIPRPVRRPGFRPVSAHQQPTAQTTRGVYERPRDSRPRATSARPASPHERMIILNSFADLGLTEPLTRALADEGYAAPTPIQTETIPLVLAARDVQGIAQTGTGKTAAFALPLLQRLAATRRRPHPRTCRVLVLSPTRELSAQIVDSFKAYGRYLRPSVALAIGGVNIKPQIDRKSTRRNSSHVSISYAVF